jgi:CRP/FNR family cyclic AMP-dependent transcriptional regulator
VVDPAIVQAARGGTELEPLTCSRSELLAMLSREHRFSSLRLDELSAPELDKLARFARVCRARRGAAVFEEGARDAYLCLIVEGEIEVRKEDGDRAGRVLATLGPGKLLGEMALLDGEPRSATAVAVADATLVILTRDDFDALLEEFPRLGVKLLRRLARLLSVRLRETSGRLVDHLPA